MYVRSCGYENITMGCPQPSVKGLILNMNLDVYYEGPHEQTHITY